MKKYLIITGIIIFILTTILVMTDDSSKKVKRLKLTNERVVVRNINTEVESKTVELNSTKTNITNENIQTSGVKTKITNEPSNIDNLTFRTDYSSETAYPETQNTSENYNTQTRRLTDIENRLKNPPARQNNTFSGRYNPPQDNGSGIGSPAGRNDRYMDRDIDWNTWKSNFINKILDDSVYIKALDEYGLGAWFYYSFNVNSDGSISDIKVVSFYLNAEDRAKVIQLIKSYAHKPITRFPAHSKRKSAKVAAAVLLGNEEKRSTPNDFNENEHIRIKY